MSRKRLLAFLVAALLLLPGCVTEDRGLQASSPIELNTNVNIKDLTEDSGEMYSGTVLLPPDGGVFLLDAAFCGKTAYFWGMDSEGKNVFYSLSGDGSHLERQNIEENLQVLAICDSQEEHLSVLTINEDGEFLLSVHNGVKIEQVSFSGLEELTDDVICQVADAEKGYVLLTSKQILVLDKDSLSVTNLGEYYGAARCIFSEDGQPLIVKGLPPAPGSVESDTEITVLDENLKPISKYKCTGQFTAFFKDNTEESTVLAYEDNTVYRLNYRDGGKQAIINTQLSGLIPNIFIKLKSDCFLSVGGGKATIWKPNDSSGSQMLTLATYGINYHLEELVRRYNESESDYKILIEDYSVFDKDGGQGAGISRLTADIVSGFTPDIYDLSVLPAELYARRGILEDLSPYFEGADDIRFPALSANAEKALKVDTGIYYIMPSYSILTVCGDRKTVGNAEAWTTEDFFKAVENTEPATVFGPEMTRDRFLANVLLFQKSNYLDTKNCCCNFSDPVFVKLLEFAAALPDNCDYSELNSDSWARVATGDQLLLMEWFDNNALSYISWANTIFNGSAQFVGFPSECYGEAAVPSALLSVSSSSQNKDAALNFISFILCDTVQGDYLLAPDFPVVDKNLRERLSIYQARYQKYPELLHCNDGYSGITIEGIMPRDKAEETLTGIVCRADLLAAYDETIIDIVLQECQPFFAGDISANQAAANIQSKAGIYIAEQYG